DVVFHAGIGQAPYAAPLLEFLSQRFETIRLFALREKLFPYLSEDAWILLAAGYGEQTGSFLLSAHDRFRPGLLDSKPDVEVPLEAWRQWNCRLRPFLIGRRARQ